MTQNMEYLCDSANGKHVVYDPVGSHTATHFEDTPHLRDLAIRILTKKVLEGSIVAEDVDMGEVVGESHVVEVDDGDDIVYAMRKNRKDQGYVPFTKTRIAEPSSLVSIYLTEKNDATYELASAWIGAYASPPFPQMENAIPDSIPYWRKHAFVWGSQEIIDGTEISEYPW